MKKIFLVLILVLAFVLRFFRLDEYPSLNADEAAIGYNAYSILHTGRDEHSNPWPLHFQSFNDYKPGLYFYLVLPFVKIIGLNEWAVRIPGAFLGVAGVYLIYLLVNEMYNKEKFIDNDKKLGRGLWKFVIDNRLMALVAAFMLAISPWHIHFSRGGWEVNVATFFMTLGVYLFFKAQKGNSLSYSSLCAMSFVFSLYTYHAARVVVPLLVLGGAVIYRDFLKKFFKNIAIAGIVGIIALLPLIKDISGSEISARAAGVGLFADNGPLARVNEQRGEHANYLGLPAKLMHNKPVNYGLAFLENWSEHFHGGFLFTGGDVIQRNKVPDTGQMYLFDILWLVVGVWWMVKNWYKRSKLVFWWMIIAPIAAALTFQSPHALRAHNMVIPITIISAMGLSQTILWLGKKIKKKYLLATCYLLLAMLTLGQFARYLHMYWVHMAKEYPFSSQYGVKELVNYLAGKQGGQRKIVITDRYDQPYILFLFYLKYPPKDFQEGHFISGRNLYGFSTVNAFANFEFKSIDWDSDKIAYPGALIIGTDEEIPDEANVVKDIYGINGYKYFQVVEN